TSTGRACSSGSSWCPPHDDVYGRVVRTRSKVWLAACVVSGLAVGAYATYESRTAVTPPIPADVAASAFARELGVAEALGFVRERVETVSLQSQTYGIEAYQEPLVVD